jgi:hypothetical protein
VKRPAAVVSSLAAAAAFAISAEPASAAVPPADPPVSLPQPARDAIQSQLTSLILHRNWPYMWGQLLDETP